MADEDPAKFAAEALPRMAAKVYLDSVTAAVSAIKGAIPDVMRSLLEKDRTEREAEDRFFKAWPQLTRELLPKILEVGKVYRGFNPQASEADYIRDVGAQAMRVLGIQVAPTAPQPPRPAPHIPLVPGVTRVALPLANGTNPWDANPFDIQDDT